MTEEFAFQQLRRDGRRVHGHKRPARALAVIMDRPGDQFLARAALAVDQDGGVALGDPADGLVDLLHRGRVPDQPAFVLLADLRAEHVHLERQATHIDRLPHQDVHLVEIEGLGDVIEGAATHGLDGVLHGRLCRHDDDRNGAPAGLDLFERLEPAHARHADVHERDRDVALADPLQGLRRVLRQRRLHPVLFQGLLQHPADAFVVIDYQYFFI